VIETLRGLDRPRTIAGHVAAFRRTLRALGLRPVPRGAQVPASAWRDARAWERLDETLRVLAGVGTRLAAGRVALARFVGLLVAALEPLEVEDPAERSGSVRALGVRDARGLDFDVVHLLGLDDGTFPAPRAESPLWPDALKREVNRPAADLLRRKLGRRGDGLPLASVLRTAREASLEDPFLFFLALSMAEREVVLSYPAVNEQGNPTVPSPFLDEVRSCTALVEATLDPTAVVPSAEACCEVAELVGRAALGRWGRRPDDAPDRLTAALVAAGDGFARRVHEIDRRAVVEERRARYFLASSAVKERFADAFVGRLGGDAAAVADRLAAIAWTPHRLEALGACGFRFFAQDVLGLAAGEDPEAAVGRAERGTLVHRVLEELVRDHPRLPTDLDAARALGRDVVARLREPVARAIRAKDPSLFDVAWRQVAATVDGVVVLEHRRQRTFAGEGTVVEYRLEPTLEHVLDGGSPLRLVGRPDRIELHRQTGRIVRLRVLDYKMTRRSEALRPRLDAARAMGTTAFQIPVYLIAAAGAVPDVAADATIEGGYLVLLADDKEVVRSFTPAELDAVAGRIRALVRAASAGRFDVDPDPCDPYCAYRAVCRYQEPPLDEDTARE
jgi:ATP-dependent helicase/DNAse subunit B